MNKLYVAMSIVILVASLIGIGLAATNFLGKLQRIEMEKARFEQDYYQNTLEGIKP